MPHVIVKLYPGRTEEQKENMTERIVQAVIECLGAPETSVSVSFEEVDKERWKEEVYLPDIVEKVNTLYRKPGYQL